MKVEIIDNFLPEHEFAVLHQLIVDDPTDQFPFALLTHVADAKTDKYEHWNWMGVHPFYRDHEPKSPHFSIVSQMIISRLEENHDLRSLIRVKGNFYPWTETIKEHEFHVDYHYEHRAAIFSLNTCDGYTLFDDGTKVESVENRLYLFNPQQKHCSSTTSNAMGRYNININFL